jgi:predicted cupin superfamily sugar epimerase
MTEKNAAYWIARLNMYPHPEGGYYKEVYRSEQQVSRAGDEKIRSACTSIYYLLKGTEFSGFHQLLSDEIWYFHTGSSIKLHIIDINGQYYCEELSASDSGNLSIAVSGKSWFAAEIPEKEGFCLVSCAVAPGFDFLEFKMANKADMLASYPSRSDIIERLCR